RDASCPTTVSSITIRITVAAGLSGVSRSLSTALAIATWNSATVTSRVPTRATIPGGRGALGGGAGGFGGGGAGAGGGPGRRGAARGEAEPGQDPGDAVDPRALGGARGREVPLGALEVQARGRQRRPGACPHRRHARVRGHPLEHELRPDGRAEPRQQEAAPV